MHEISTKIKKKNTKLEATLVLSNSATNGIISQNDYFDKDIANDENIDKYYVISKGDFVYNPRKSSNAPYGPINILEKYDKGIASPLYTCFSIKTDKQEFLKYYFKSNKWHRFIYINGDKGARGDRVSIKDDVFYKMPIMIPTYLESEKLSNLLSLLERKITIARSKYETLKKYKKGLSKIAIKDSVNNWIYKNESGTALGTFLREINEYSKKDNGFTHVTLSKDGIGNKSDRYDRDFLVKTEDKKYKITRFNQLCYNPANLKFGVICINKFGDGIFSPIYITYQIKGIDVDYLELLVTSDDFRNYSMKYQQGTVFERMSVSPEDLQKIKIVPACKERQLLLSVTVKAINKKMKHFEEKLSLLSSLKKILLNDLFI